MRFACADFSFPLLSHDQSLQLIAMLGFDGVDIGLFEGRSHLWPSVEFARVVSSAKRLRQKLDGLGLLAADVFLQMEPDFIPFAINHPEKERRKKAREWFLRSLEYAGTLECRHLTTLPGVHFENETTEDSFNRSVAELHWRVEQAQKHGVIFGAEAHVGSIASDPGSAGKLVQAVPGLTLTLDYTHFTRVGLSDELVEPLVKYASHFHVRGRARDAYRLPSPITSLITSRFGVRSRQRIIKVGWELNTCILIGNIATSATIFRRRFCFVIMLRRC